MVSSQLLLAIGVAVPLLAIAGYAAWLGQRVAALERRAEAVDPGDGDDPGEAER